MAQNSNYTTAKSNAASAKSDVKHYGDSSYVTKKTEAARETLKKFPVPEKYCK
ncbi:hypothetical protein [Mucilaginibacter sp.]|uniref:hypothetical protein n=1 Tax=Mucilaginibacter sp. TaxID=1882438 RepID=UPI0028511C21|nr:hypothetical protein [Mucilaginibacter sp.]MDR3695783.1 hypothetical protein [Mucilaginibacter sp.]